MIDYRIRTFLELYETMNYRKTGEKLRLSQPAVSQQIHFLEREYGCKLFVYDGRRLHRTPQADKVAEYARAAWYNEQQLRKQLEVPPKREIRLGATKTIGEYIIAQPLLEYVLHNHDSLTIDVDNTEVLLHKLEHEELDFALVEGAFDKNKYGHRLYRRCDFVGMCHPGHPFAGKTVSLGDLLGQSVILREKGSGTRAILEHTLEDYGYSVDIFSRVICSSNFSLILQFVEHGCGITFAYAPIAQGHEEGLRFFHLDCLNEQYELNMVYLKGTLVFPLIQEIFQDMIIQN